MHILFTLAAIVFATPAHAQGMDSDGNIVREDAEKPVNITPQNDEATRGATIENENNWFARESEAWSSGQFGAQPSEEDAAATDDASAAESSDVEVQEQGGMTIRTKDGHYLGPDGLTINPGQGRYVMPDGSLFIDQGEDLDLPPQ